MGYMAHESVQRLGGTFTDASADIGRFAGEARRLVFQAKDAGYVYHEEGKRLEKAFGRFPDSLKSWSDAALSYGARLKECATESKDTDRQTEGALGNIRPGG
jgi:hypothetical protein